MAEVDKFIAALEEYYEATYNPAQKAAILKGLGHPAKTYLLNLYTEITNQHSSQYKKAPDLAVIRKVQHGMNPPEVLSSPALPDPDDIQGDFNEEVKQIVDASLKARPEENNKIERDRIRERVRHGEATRAERWWLKIVEDGGKWSPMPESFD